MHLTFVDNNGAIDKTTRTMIRRHAAKGQNLGRKINRLSRVEMLSRRAQPRVFAVACPDNASEDARKEMPKEERISRPVTAGLLPQVEPLIGDSISILNLPIQVAPEDRALMAEAVAFMGSPRFVPSLAKALDPSKANHSIYQRLMFTDQAYYHCALAVTLECAPILPQAKRSAMRHITQSFGLVNERLSRTEEITNPTMAVVMSLSTYESTRGHYGQGLVHIAGLLRMIEMRGGLEAIVSEEPEIMQKAYRSDLDYALRLGTSPRLDIRPFEDSKAMEKLDVRPVRGEGAFSDYYQGFRAQLDTELSWLWDRVGDVATLVNEACTGERAKLVPAQFMRSHVWLGHRLLNFAPLSNTHPLNRIQSMAYLGLVTLISSFICGLDRRVVENPILSELIHNETSLGADPETRELYLWLLFIGGAVMLQDPSHDVWLLPRMWETMQALRLHTWDDTRRVLLRFPWINDFYGEKASSLYTRATIYGRL